MLLRGAFIEGSLSALRLAARPSRPLLSCLRPGPTPRYVSQLALRVQDAPTESSASDDQRTPLERAIDDFHLAVTTQPAQSPRPSYDNLVACIESLGDIEGQEIPNLQSLEKALVQLAERKDHEDPDILPDAIERTARLVGLDADKYVRHVFYDLYTKNTLNAAFRWLSALGEMKSVTYASQLSPWQKLLRARAKRYDFNGIVEILRRMHELGVPATGDTSQLIVNTLFSTRRSARGPLPPSYTGIRFLIKAFASCGYPYDPTTLSTLINGYARAGMKDAAQDVEVMYIARLGSPGLYSLEQLNSILAGFVERMDRHGMTSVYKYLARVGLSPSETTFSVVLGRSDNLGDLKYWEDVLEMKATPRVIARMMEQRAKGNKPNFQLYEYAVSTGIPLSGPMLHYVVKPLLTSRGLEKPTEKAIDQALDYYRAFIARLDAIEGTGEGHGDARHQDDTTKRIDLKDRDVYPSAATYQLLLRALNSAKNVSKYLPTAVSLVADMRRFNVQLDWQSATSVIIILMDASPTPEEAFRMYRLIAQPEGDLKKGPKLNEEGYVAILHAFCNLPTWPNGIPSVQLYFDIINDMRKLRIPLGPKVYTIILAQMARLATAISTDDTAAREAIAKAIARVHNHLNLNPSFTPDTALWNQLMDAYQRAGCFAEACRIWQTLFASVRFNRASVSIILDACAFARAYDFAVRVYAALTEVEFPMNVRNWNTYLECLCRLGRLDEAMKVLCLEMTGRNDGVEPDKESARILLKFAAKENRESEVRSRLKRFLPKLYHAVIESI